MRSTSPCWAALVALTVLGSCSSSSPTSPGQVGAGLPGTTGAAPTPKSDVSVEKLTLKGRVVDARTGESLGKATVVVMCIPS
jgi:hypothetical protein